MAVNLLTPLDAYDAAALARAHDEAGRAGFRLHRIDAPNERLASWIDFHFAPSWWSSEAAAGSTWVAERDGEVAGFASFGARGLRYPWLRAAGAKPGVGIFGPYGVAEAFRGRGAGVPLLTAALCGLREAGSREALIPAVNDDTLAAMYVARTGARIVEEFGYDVGRFRTTILASGSGTNARSVMEQVVSGRLPLDLTAVITNHAGAGVLEAAATHRIPAATVAWNRELEARSAYDARLIATVESTQPQLVLLLGWMHLVPPAFLERFPETLNLHPAFLPLDPGADEAAAPDGTRIRALRGAHALRDAIVTGAAWTGVTVHRVTAATDRGAVLVRTPMPIEEPRTEAALRERIRPLEFAAVTAAIRRWTFER